jgi:very-short-patch-repair endonuclease
MQYTETTLRSGIKIIGRQPTPTREAADLIAALKKRNIEVDEEPFDGHKHVDLAVPKAKLNIEVDRIHHLTDPNQIVADLSRGYYSYKDGINTMHIPNEMIRKHLNEISDALAIACKKLERQIHVHTE